MIKGFGFPTLQTLLVQMISVAFQLVFVFISSFGSTYFANTRTYFLAANLSISIAGSAMIRQIGQQHMWPRFFGFCLNMAFTANFPIVLSMSSANVAGFTKKSTANSMVSWTYFSVFKEQPASNISDNTRLLTQVPSSSLSPTASATSSGPNFSSPTKRPSTRRAFCPS